MILRINTLGELIVKEKNQETFNEMIKEHEEIISKIVSKTNTKGPVRRFLRPNKKFRLWGGDFILASGDNKTPKYFKERI